MKTSWRDAVGFSIFVLLTSLAIFVLFGSVALIGIEVTTGQKPHETLRVLANVAKEDVPVWTAMVYAWLETGDNLLTVLGMLAGFLMSGGLWQWRKAKAFQKDEHGKRVQELIELKQQLEECGKERHEYNVRIANIHNEYRKEAKQAEQNHLRRCENEMEQGRNEGSKEVAKRIVYHLLQTGQLFYSLDAEIGMIALHLMGNAKIKESLPDNIISGLIDLSGMRHPPMQPTGKVMATTTSGKWEEPWQTTGTGVREKQENEYNIPCVWCGSRTTNRWHANQDWCKDCGPKVNGMFRKA